MHDTKWKYDACQLEMLMSKPDGQQELQVRSRSDACVRKASKQDTILQMSREAKLPSSSHAYCPGLPTSVLKHC